MVHNPNKRRKQEMKQGMSMPTKLAWR